MVMIDERKIKSEIEKLKEKAEAKKEARKLAIHEATMLGGLTGQGHVNLAKFFVAANERKGTTLVYADGEVRVYSEREGIWRVVEDSELERRIGDLDGIAVPTSDGSRPWRFSNNDVIGTAARIRAEIADNKFFSEAPVGVALQDVWLSVDEAGQIIVREHSPDHRAVHRLAASWCTERGTRFVQLIESVIPDAQDRATIQEWAGAMIMGRAPAYQRVIWLQGPPGSGKSQVLEAISATVPDDQRAAMPPHTLAAGRERGEYYRAKLAGLLLNVCADVSANAIPDVGVLKQMSTGDEMSGRHPSGRPIHFRPRAGHIMSCNELPQIKDPTGAAHDRMVVIRCPHRFRDMAGEVRSIGAKIAADPKELAGIVAWAVEGAQRLFQRGHYEISDSSKRLVAEWRDESDPILVWLATFWMKTSKADKDGPTTDHLHKHYEMWCIDQRVEPVSKIAFGRALVAAGVLRERTKTGAVYGLLAHPDAPATKNITVAQALCAK